MSDILQDEVDDGQQLAEELAEHLSIMGASSAEFRTEIDGDEYIVTVQVKAKRPN